MTIKYYSIKWVFRQNIVDVLSKVEIILINKTIRDHNIIMNTDKDERIHVRHALAVGVFEIS